MLEVEVSEGCILLSRGRDEKQARITTELTVCRRSGLLSDWNCRKVSHKIRQLDQSVEILK
jgi:hypothetical protein